MPAIDYEPGWGPLDRLINSGADRPLICQRCSYPFTACTWCPAPVRLERLKRPRKRQKGGRCG
jgi:hypothetical protein